MTTISEANQNQFDEVLQWLKQEQDGSDEGFYCNKELIGSSFAAREMICLSEDSQAIGFGIFNVKTFGASIDFLEIHPQHRGSGHGTKLAAHLIGHLFCAGCAHVSVKCAPRSSEQFWRKLGFIDKGESVKRLPPLELWLLGGAA